jgi:hypothetical protein
MGTKVRFVAYTNDRVDGAQVRRAMGRALGETRRLEEPRVPSKFEIEQRRRFVDYRRVAPAHRRDLSYPTGFIWWLLPTQGGGTLRLSGAF